MTINTKVEEFVADYFKSHNFDPSHDIFHVRRVRDLALKIADEEARSGSTKVNFTVVELAALLHDIGDFKYAKENDKPANEEITSLLKSLNYEASIIAQVLFIVENISFRKEIEILSKKKKFSFPVEFAIVQDADRLDAIGSIGIARCFSFGAVRNRPIYDPAIPVMGSMSKEDYDNQIKSNTGMSLNHFYEKLFKLKSLMKTEGGKRRAEQRHKAMEDFVSQFLLEVKGDS